MSWLDKNYRMIMLVAMLAELFLLAWLVRIESRPQAGFTSGMHIEHGAAGIAARTSLDQNR